MAGEEQHREKLAEMGAEIRARREGLGLSIEEASDRTKIRAKYLRAVEAGDESPAPGTTYFKAFLKTYAMSLGLDGTKYSLAYQEILDLRSAPPSRERARPEKSKAEVPARPERTAADQLSLKPVAPRPKAQVAKGTDMPVPPPTLVRLDKGAGIAPGAGKPAPAKAAARTGAKAEAPQHRPPRRPRRSPRPAVWAFMLFFVVAVVVFVVVSREKAAGVVGPGTPPDGVPAGPGTPGQPGGETKPPEPPAAKIARTDPDKETTVFTIDQTPLELTIKIAKDVDSYCWVRVSLDGRIAFERTLSPGSEEKVSAKSEIVIRAGKPWVMALTLNGKDLGAPGEFGPVKDVIVRSVPKSP